MNRPQPQISKIAMDQLAAYHWPGNVRELQNMVERAVILWREGPLSFDLPEDSLPLKTNGTQPVPVGNVALLTRDELKRQERDAIIRALKQTSGKVSGPGGASIISFSAGSTMARASSGSRSSISSIDPLMSANRAVTVLRSPSSEVSEISALTRIDVPASGAAPICRHPLIALHTRYRTWW